MIIVAEQSLPADRKKPRPLKSGMAPPAAAAQLRYIFGACLQKKPESENIFGEDQGLHLFGTIC
ncbi:MAG: hypothetical protein FD151_1746 [bacterium]|nr:MAG: hypothetical protein FD151_1746 [bacterium]